MKENQEFIKSFEEVDLAFAERFSNIIIDGKRVKVMYYTPDVDLLSVDELPVITIYRTNPFRDVARWNNHHEIIDKPEYDENGRLIKVSRRRFPEPWAVLYGLRVVYAYQQDGVELNNQILRTIERDDVLNIKGYNYLIELEKAGMWGSQYKDFGRIEEGRRRFQERYDYRVDIWLEIAEREEVKTVQQVGVRPYTFDTIVQREERSKDGYSKEQVTPTISD